MFPKLAVVLRLRGLPRRADLDDRATVLTLFARFTDELASGLLIVLMPTLRTRLGLTVQQIGWCFQAMFSVGALVEPFSGAAIDLIRRRPLLVGGAAGWAGALLLAAGAPGFGWLLAAFGLAGAAYGPLANTADVVLVEGHPAAVERISSRSTALDTVGALLAPGSIALAGWAGVDGRLLLAAAGTGAMGYAVLLAGSVLPSPPARPDGTSGPVHVLANVRAVVADPQARVWISALLLIEVFDPIEVFEPVWLGDVVGASQAQVAVHSIVGLVGGLLALVALDRWLARRDATVVLVMAATATLVVYPVWLLVPGLAAKLALVAVRNAVLAPLWPIVHSRALASVPGSAGAVSALTALVALLPLPAVFGWLAGRVGLTPSMLGVHVVTTLAVLALLRRMECRRAPAAIGKLAQ